MKDTDIIYGYSREQAIEDGVLVDLSEWASADKGFMGGFKCPVAVTSALWDGIEKIGKKSCQDVRGRAHDVLFMGSLAMRSMIKRDVQDTYFKVLLQVGRKRKHVLRISFRGNEGVTIGFPEDF
ncbi:MAG: DUF6573 family protein [Planctomycetota bacterium]